MAKSYSIKELQEIEASIGCDLDPTKTKFYLDRMQKKIMFEFLYENKKEFSEYLKRVGLSGKHIESFEVCFHPDGEVSFIKPKLRF